MIRRTLLFGFGMLLALGVGAVLLAGRFDFAALAAHQASQALGRDIAIASLRLHPGAWLRLDIAGLTLANPPGGSRPAMLTLRQASAEVEVLSLLRGPVRLRAVTVEGLSVLLERLPGQPPNWRFAPPRAATAAAPEDRGAVPLLRDLLLRDAELLLRTRAGATLRVALEEASLTTTGEDQPLLLRGQGAYNATPVGIEAQMDPVATLRTAAPYGVDLRLVAGADTHLHFLGTAAAPLEGDGLSGSLSLQAPNLATLMEIAGTDLPLKAPIALHGQMVRQDRLWRLTEASGKLAGQPLAVELAELLEGQQGEADAVRLALDLAALDLDQLLAGLPAGAVAPDADPPLRLSATPDPQVEGRITLGRLQVSGVPMTRLALAGAITPGRIAVPELALTVHGARITGDASLEAKGEGAAIRAALALHDGDLETLRRAFGLRDLPLNGQLEGRLAVTAEGNTLQAAARQARVGAVVAMHGGRIAREVMEMASLDPRLLFRRAEGETALACMLSVLDLNAGQGTIAPLRLRAGNGTISGTASVNLPRRTVDLVIGTESATTGSLALDVPVRVSGSFASPSVRPAAFSAAGRARLNAQDQQARLPAALRAFANANPCAQPTPAPG